MALNATAIITAAAATEYQHYVKVREELRQPAPSTPPVRGEAGSAEPDVTGGEGATEEAAETSGAGAAAVAVLAPVLIGTAAAILLLVGYMLKMLDPEPGITQYLVTTGWVFSAITAATILVAAVGLLNARHNGASSLQALTNGERSEAASRAREAWHDALLERGILPFLREAVGVPATAALHSTKSTCGIPQLGYHRPGFNNADAGPGSSAAGPRSKLSNSDFSSPDFGGPEHTPE